MTASAEFSTLTKDESQTTHLFIAVKHHSDHAPTWVETVDLCLTAWKLQAAAYREYKDTGYKEGSAFRVLTEEGKAQLTTTPPEDENITRNVFITDISEVVALRLLKHFRPTAKFPRPRVLHKEVVHLQHHGIDILGYEETTDGYILLVVEVMASVEQAHPPQTVKYHYKQIMDQTLNQTPPKRLLEDLGYVHDECSGDADRDVLNAFITAVTRGELQQIKDAVSAVGVLVRPRGMWQVDDWKPFLENTVAFENANIPATVWFGVVESDCSFSELMERVKNTAAPPKREGEE